ncbi:imm11 family protein [Pseudomonas monteilii]
MALKEYYVVSYENVAGIPRFFEAEWYPKLPELNQTRENPEKSSFESFYALELNLEKFEIDAVLEKYIVSSRFVSLCSRLECEYIDVPLEVELSSGEKLENFRFFYVLSRGSLLDVEKSKFVLTDKGLLRPDSERLSVLPVYDKIDRFVVKENIHEDLLFCEELKQVVCSSDFKENYFAEKLVGLKFEKIDEKFVFDPWGDW